MVESKYSIRAKYIALEVFNDMPRLDINIKARDKRDKNRDSLSPLDERLLVVEQVLDKFVDNLAYLIEKQIVDALIPPPEKVAEALIEIRSNKKK